MARPPHQMTIECPGCARCYEDRYRAAIDAALEGEASVDEDGWRKASRTACPACARVIEFGLLVLEEDGVWRVSPFAGRSADVVVIPPPGGQIPYGSGPAHGAATSPEPEVRRRALRAIEGRAAGVGPGAQREAVELALRAGALDAGECERARSWLSSASP